MSDYNPHPIDTSGVVMDDELVQLTEKLAENAHENWAALRVSQGWTYGTTRDDLLQTHPNLVPYAELSEADKDLDRGTAMETIKAVLALGYQIRKPGAD
ncbi:MAG: Ryanodine receptor Ryr [Alphaproteobacteria bacterium]|nr:Ryanodine receptor Ryr [Alphaproteobacteria bacterium]